MYAVLAVLCLAALISAQQLVDPSQQQTFQQQQSGNVQFQTQQGQGFNQEARTLGSSYVAANLQPGQAAVVTLGRPQTTYVAAQRPVVVNYAQQQQQQGYDAQQTISAVEASRAQIAAAIAQGANPNNFAVQTNAHYNIATQPNVQNPDVYTALDALRGRNDLTIDEILNILSNAVAGRDYPIHNDIPSTRFTCENVKQAGFYADAEAQCQVIRRCDINGVLWSYLCPNMTLFNQITLVCDWFFNVNCNNAVQYYDYSNPRLYTQFALLDTPANVYQPQNQPRPSNQQYNGFQTGFLRQQTLARQ